ncbi:hypothetical protein BDV59DRAFT_180591 [Aspergillus ambiguus]|uniref:uncharacterized protein n=1 Tax=Aspergillus ambiguus TaxID=176160 RepID=UPI003CCDCCD3
MHGANSCIRRYFVPPFSPSTVTVKMSLPPSEVAVEVPERQEPSSYDDDQELPQPPPSYAVNEAEPVPPYAPPEYTSIIGGPATVQPATTKVPPALNGYWQWKLTRTVLLGPSAEEMLFAVSTHTHMFRSRQSIVLHDGPSDKHTNLATLESDITGRKRPCVITIPQHPGRESQGPVVVEFNGNPDRRYHKEPSFSFSCVVGRGKGATKEEFEWRRSHGKEIKELDIYSFGWKLVRMSRASSEERGNPSQSRPEPAGRTREVVAIMAHNSSMSMTKAFRFAFWGSGLLGTMGHDWEVIVLISAIHLFNLDVQTVAMAAAIV